MSFWVFVGANVSSRPPHGGDGQAEALFRIADHFGVCVDDVRPAANGDGTWVPAPFRLGVGRSGAAGVGGVEPPERIELSTYSLRVNRSAD